MSQIDCGHPPRIDIRAKQDSTVAYGSDPSENPLRIYGELSDFPQRRVPEAILKYLTDTGWYVASHDMVSGEALFMNNGTSEGKDITEALYYRWHEAVAFNFFRFMTITTMQP